MFGSAGFIDVGNLQVLDVHFYVACKNPVGVWYCRHVAHIEFESRQRKKPLP